MERKGQSYEHNTTQLKNHFIPCGDSPDHPQHRESEILGCVLMC